MYRITTDIYLTEKQTEFYPSEIRPCKRYNPGDDRNSIKQDSRDFIKCSKELIWNLLKTQIYCSIIGLEPFFDHPNEMKECQSKEEAEATFTTASNIFLDFETNRKLWDSLCPLPCIQVTDCKKSFFMTFAVSKWHGHVLCINLL